VRKPDELRLALQEARLTNWDIKNLNSGLQTRATDVIGEATDAATAAGQRHLLSDKHSSTRGVAAVER
jgi:hypothetical protein